MFYNRPFETFEINYDHLFATAIVISLLQSMDYKLGKVNNKQYTSKQASSIEITAIF